MQVRAAIRADFEALSVSESPLMFDWSFLELLARASGYPNSSLSLVAGGEHYLFPLLRRYVAGLYPIHFSLPFGHHASLFPEPGSPELYHDLVRAARRHLGGCLVLQNQAHEMSIRSGLYAVATHTCHLLRTRDVSYEHMFTKTFDAKLRNQIRRAQKSLVEVRSSNDLESIGQFYALYLLSNERWGRKVPKYSLQFFKTFAQAPLFEIKLAVHEERAIAGIVLLKFRDQVMYWFGALDKTHSTLCPNHLLISLALKDAIADGRTWFNFGVSGGLDTVRKFKESFGAEARSYKSYFSGNSVIGVILRNRMRGA